MSGEDFLSRWSRRKTASKSAAEEPKANAAPEAAPIAPPAPPPSTAQRTAAEPVAREEPAPLPPIESLTSESDFVPFMQAEVDPGLKRQAFKKLIEDPRFNVMDGLDVYIDDYSKPDPLPEGWLAKMNQMKHLGIFQPAEEEAVAEAAPRPAEGAEPLRQAIPADAPSPPAPAASPDTLTQELPPVEVGKSGVSQGGI